MVPGVYTNKELTHAARLIVVSKKTNGGCNCLAGQGVVLARDWAQKNDFVAALYGNFDIISEHSSATRGCHPARASMIYPLYFYFHFHFHFLCGMVLRRLVSANNL